MKSQVRRSQHVITLECECFIPAWVEIPAFDVRRQLSLFIRQQHNSHVRIGRSGHVFGRQFRRADNPQIQCQRLQSHANTSCSFPNWPHATITQRRRSNSGGPCEACPSQCWSGAATVPSVHPSDVIHAIVATRSLRWATHGAEPDDRVDPSRWPLKNNDKIKNLTAKLGSDFLRP